jgi:hypothetical protein
MKIIMSRKGGQKGVGNQSTQDEQGWIQTPANDR